MNIIKISLIAAAAMSLSGCANLDLNPFHNLRDAVHGEPRINDNVFMGRNRGDRDDYDYIPSVVPIACLPEGYDAGGKAVPNDSSNTLIKTDEINRVAEKFYKNMQHDQIVNCVDAMKLLVDTRWAHFEHVLNASLSTSNFLVDATITGLATSIPLVAAGTRSVLGAIAAGLSGTRKNFDEDVLYSMSIQTIVLQMKTDRASQAAAINSRLNSKTNFYRNMYEAASDLFDYDQAGSWDHAMSSLRTNVAAVTAACQARLRDQKMEKPTDSHPEGVAATSTATDPCSVTPVSANLNTEQAALLNGTTTLNISAKGVPATGTDDQISAIVAAYTLAKANGTVGKIKVQALTTPSGTKSANDAAAAARLKEAIALLTTGTGITAAQITTLPADPKSKTPGVNVSFEVISPVVDAGSHSSTFSLNDLIKEGFSTKTKDGSALVVTKSPDSDGNNAEYTLQKGTDPATAGKGSVADIMKLITG